MSTGASAGTGPAMAAAVPPPGGTAGRPALWRELLVGLLVFGVYAAVTGLHSPGREVAAAGHARDILRLERRLHIDVEAGLNAWLAPHRVLSTLANYEYAFSYVLSAFILLFWVYARRPAAYRWARSSFIVLNLVGVTCFALYPLTPPRLLAGQGYLDRGYLDTVLLGRTWGSWGSPLVAHANTLAAMPSLHVAWALWVSIVLAYVAGGPIVQAASALHVLLTVYVIMATANHYLLDAFAAAVLVAVSVRVGRLVSPPPATGRGRRVPAADSFFLHVESAAAPQHVGGVVLLDVTGAALERERVVAAVRAALPRLPRFRQRLAAPSRWRRPRWVDLDERDLDWSWHVPERHLGAAGPGGDGPGGDGPGADRPGADRPGGDGPGGDGPGADRLGGDGLGGDGLERLHELVAGIAAARLPRDRPMWRLFVVQGVAEGRAAVVLVVHHVIADGIGTVAQALNLLEPAPPVAGQAAGRHGPGRLTRVAATAAGLAQLATDGRPAGPLPGAGGAGRGFSSVVLPLAEVREVARRHGVRITDLLLSATAGAVSRTLGGPAGAPPPPLRAAVTLMVRAPGAAQEGNLTAGVMVDLPLDAGDEPHRLRAIADRTRRLRTPSRALASRFVMQGAGELMPPPLHRWFARTVYGGRFFDAIVSNMPGPQVQLHMAGVPLRAAFPLLPLAPGAPLAVGALGWQGRLCVGIATDTAVIPDAGAFAAALSAVFDQLRWAEPVRSTLVRA